jgi:hypothetical protein
MGWQDRRRGCGRGSGHGGTVVTDELSNERETAFELAAEVGLRHVRNSPTTAPGV